MFINKFKDHPVTSYSKMTSYINLFLKTEVTCIPKILKNYIGDYYNNALFNGATWVFVLWCVLHLVFEKLVDAFLKKLRYREYVRSRLRNSLWYLGFYGTAIAYSQATLARNEIELFNFKRMHVPSSSNLPSQVVIGYTLISTFFLHSALWEGLSKEYILNMLSYVFLFFFLVSSYILRIVEISFTLTALTGITQVALEFTRCCFMSAMQESMSAKVFLGLLYFVSFAVCFAVYIVVIPLTFVLPLGLKILSDYPNMLLVFLFINLVVWLIVEIYQSVIFKFIEHWFYHREAKESDEVEADSSMQCAVGLLECSLFKQRDDVSYNLKIIKKEIKARQTKMLSMRKPKLLQTFKCMLAIKKRLIDKRKSDSSDSESETSDLQKHTVEDKAKLLPDQSDVENDTIDSESPVSDQSGSERSDTDDDTVTVTEAGESDNGESVLHGTLRINVDSEKNITEYDSTIDIKGRKVDQQLIKHDVDSAKENESKAKGSEDSDNNNTVSVKDEGGSDEVQISNDSTINDEGVERNSNTSVDGGAESVMN